MPFNPKILTSVLDARGVDAGTLSTALKMSNDRLTEALAGKRVPTKNQIFKLAEVLAVPAYAFFLSEFSVKPSELMDFRNRKPKRMKYGLHATKFESLFNLRDFLADLYTRLDIDAPQQLLSEQPDENPEQFASTIAKILSIETIRNSTKTKRDFYRLFRDKVEDLGIFVIQNHLFPVEIDGLAIYHSTFSSNLIYINSSRRNHGAKTFTLAHELAHILGKRSAISDNYGVDNEVEKFCNRFAASLLLPRSGFFSFVEQRNLSFQTYDSAINSADKISRHFKTSVSAALVRASELGLADGDYYRRFASGFGSVDYLDTIKPKGGGGSEEGPEPGIIDLAQYGKRAVAIIAQSLIEKKTTEYEVFKRTSLSKKRIEGLMLISAKENLIKSGDTSR